MRNVLQRAGCLFVLLLFSAAASATIVKSTYIVSYNKKDPGLVVQVDGIELTPFTHEVTKDNPVTIDLFNIWTDENSLDSSGFLNLGCGPDCDSKPIDVLFGFILPEVGESTVHGETHGVKILGGIAENGKLTWNGPAEFSFGPLGDGLLQISLSDETFNRGYWGGLHEGPEYGATVTATITLLSDATAVPEPSILALFGFGLIGLGFAARRRRD